jgi:valine--pyruvate aminotransferase
MKYSDFGQKFNRHAGISLLMEDLSEGLQRDDMIMLGGGNPAQIPAALDVFEHALGKLLKSGELVQALTNYDAAQGNQAFLEALADYFQRHYGWNITRKNIALTHGSQSAFFTLFNSFAGKSGSSRKHVLLPITPEYIGYTDVGVEDDIFVSQLPQIETLDDQFFKYHIDFEQLEITAQTGLICVSRPTNPSGNVLTDDECRQLDRLAQKHDIPLLVDNAYGTPFPHIIFNQVNPFWNDNTIVCLSLSKLGLPGVRTGIVIANEEIIRQLSNMTAISSLAPGGVGPVVVNELLREHALTALCDDVIRPFYQQRCNDVVGWLKQAIDDERLHIHLPEGAIFVWLWFEGLSITTDELYEVLKLAGLLIVPGKYFFPGQQTPGEHAQSCIRMNYVQSEDDLRKGIEILATTLKKYW